MTSAVSASAAKADLEEGLVFAPRFGGDGLIPCVTTRGDGSVLMLAYMNAQALDATLATGVAHYWSRSRNRLWRKGDTSGQTQRVIDLRTDCDQDALLLRVEVEGDGGACHTGRTSCFYRRVETGPEGTRLVFEAAGPD